MVDWEGEKVVEIVKLFVAEALEDHDTLVLGEEESEPPAVGVPEPTPELLGLPLSENESDPDVTPD